MSCENDLREQLATAEARLAILGAITTAVLINSEVDSGVMACLKLKHWLEDNGLEFVVADCNLAMQADCQNADLWLASRLDDISEYHEK